MIVHIKWSMGNILNEAISKDCVQLDDGNLTGEKILGWVDEV